MQLARTQIHRLAGSQLDEVEKQRSEHACVSRIERRNRGHPARGGIFRSSLRVRHGLVDRACDWVSCCVPDCREETLERLRIALALQRLDLDREHVDLQLPKSQCDLRGRPKATKSRERRKRADQLGLGVWIRVVALARFESDARRGFPLKPFPSLLAVRVRLDRKRLGGSQNLEEKRQLAIEAGGGWLAEEPRRIFAHEIGQRNPAAATSSPRRILRMGAHPDLGLRPGRRSRLTEQLRNRATRTPRVLPDRIAKRTNPDQTPLRTTPRQQRPGSRASVTTCQVCSGQPAPPSRIHSSENHPTQINPVNWAPASAAPSLNSGPARAASAA